jgi:ATP-binding cassette, subfamily G (WHITE), member 2, PDR
MQIQLCTRRGFQRLQGDMSLFFTGLFGQTALALIIASVFYNLQNTTATLYSRGALLFFAILMAAFQSSLEVSLAKYGAFYIQPLMLCIDLNPLCPTTNC